MSTGTTITIRGLQSDDWEVFLPLSRNLDALRDTVDLPYPAEDAFRERFNAASSDVHTLIVEISLSSGRRQPVGAAWLDVRPARRRHKGRLRLVVLPDYRGTEVETRLLQGALQYADDWLGLRRIEVVIFADDDRGRNLYEEHGFEVEARMRRYALRAGRLADADFLARLRQPEPDTARDEEEA